MRCCAGTVKKVPPLKIVHMKYAVKGTRKDDASRAYDELLADMEFAARSNPEVQVMATQGLRCGMGRSLCL
jgi:hypothetical protein